MTHFKANCENRAKILKEISKESGLVTHRIGVFLVLSLLDFFVQQQNKAGEGIFASFASGLSICFASVHDLLCHLDH